MTTLHFYRTLWHGALRTTLSIPSGLYLLPFSSWFAASRPGMIMVPELPPDMIYSVDSGAYRYRDGQYPYQPLEYLRWCQTLQPAPQWVVMPDWFGQQPAPYTFPIWSLHATKYGPYPQSDMTHPLTSHILMLCDLFAARFQGSNATRVMQLRTSLMAYTIWDRFRDVVACWSPV